MKNAKLSIVTLALIALTVGSASSHCQIPCGIYDDAARFTLMREHVTTIEKSMKLIRQLEAAKPLDGNQLTRWVANKEQHADKLTEIVTAYFMAQRVKPTTDANKAARERYLMQVEVLHRLVVHAMKAKQTTDLTQCAALREGIDGFEKLYLSR